MWSELNVTTLGLTSGIEVFLAAMYEYVTFSYYVTNNFALFSKCGNSEFRFVKMFNPPRMFYFGGILG